MSNTTESNALNHSHEIERRMVARCGKMYSTRLIKGAKDTNLSEKCIEIEENEKNGFQNMYKKIKELTSKKKYNRPTTSLLNKNGILKTEVEDLLAIWK